MAAACSLTVPSVLVLALFSLCCLRACGGRLLSVDAEHSVGDRSLRSRSLHRSGEALDEVRETVSSTLLPESAPSFVAEERRSVRSSQPVKRAAGGEGAMGVAKHGGAVAPAGDLETSEEGGIDGARGASAAAAAAAAGAVRTEYMGTVSWQVPRDPHRVHPVYNIDYDAPRTHPPSHN